MVPMTNEEKSARGTHDTPEELKIYELGYLLAPTIPEEDIGGENVKVKDVLEKAGFIMSSDEPAMRTLAYEMSAVIGGKKRRFRTAYFGSIVFQTGAASVADVKMALGKNENVTRSLILHRTKESLLPSKRKILVAPRGAEEKEAGRKKQSERAEKAIDEVELDKKIEEMVAE